MLNDLAVGDVFNNFACDGCELAGSCILFVLCTGATCACCHGVGIFPGCSVELNRSMKIGDSSIAPSLRKRDVIWAWGFVVVYVL